MTAIASLPYPPISAPRTGAALSSTPAGGLELQAGAGGDAIDVRQVAQGRYAVTVNEQRFLFSREELARLTIHAGDGDNRVRIDPSVDVPVALKTGRGRDVVLNGARGATIDTGAGDDHVVSAADGTKIHGGEGDDVLDVQGHGNTVSGGMHDDRLRVQGQGNLVQGGAGHDGLWVYGADNFVRGGAGDDQAWLWGTRNRVDLMGGDDRLTAIGSGNQLQGGEGWNRIGVLGFGNVVDGQQQRHDPRFLASDLAAHVSAVALLPAAWSPAAPGAAAEGLVLPEAGGQTPAPGAFDALQVHRDLRQWTSDCGSRGCCKWEPAIA